MYESPIRNALSPAKARLLALMQQLNWGRIESLHVSDGEPLFEPPPRIVRDIKLGSENGPRNKPFRQDFFVKIQLSELFMELEELGEGVVERLEVKRGLPYRLRVETPLEG